MKCRATTKTYRQDQLIVAFFLLFRRNVFERFCNDTAIGEAIRQARLKLLSEGNPLGLVYIPFVQADLKLEYAE